MKMQKTIIVGIVIAVLFQLNGAHVFAQVNRNVISERTLTKEGIKYTIVKCRINYTNNPVDGELIGVKINNNWVVPCNYDSVILRNGYFYAYHGEYWADMFTTDGRLSKKWYITRMKNRQFFSDSQKDSGYDTKWYDENGKYICTGNSLMEGPGNEVFVKTGSYGREGISTIDGKVILAPEFYTCWYLGDNFFVFRMTKNDYNGVVKRNGQVIIPPSRQYTSIQYSSTIKKFTFDKTIINKIGGKEYYRGECDANGAQTAIYEVPAP